MIDWQTVLSLSQRTPSTPTHSQYRNKADSTPSAQRQQQQQQFVIEGTTIGLADAIYQGLSDELKGG